MPYDQDGNWVSNNGPNVTNEQYQKLIQDQKRMQELEAQMKAKGTLRTNDQGFTTVSGGMNRMGQLRPDYISMVTPEGELDPRFKQTLGTSYSALRDKAMAEGDMDAIGMMRQQLGQQTAAQRDAISRDAGYAATQARSNLAMRGGLRGGASERLGGQAMRQQMLGNQQLGRDYNMQNLGLSLQNEQMKNQYLGQIGGVEQTMDAANVGRFEQDMNNRNLFAANMYGEDAQAYAAEKSAQAQAAASCFIAGSKVKMADGKEKRIEDVKLGDICKDGGEVFFLSQAKVPSFYIWNGVGVTGTHAARTKDGWKRIEDMEDAIPVNRPEVVYCIGNTNHILLIEGQVFADYYETDQYDDVDLEESLMILNGNDNVLRLSS